MEINADARVDSGDHRNGRDDGAGQSLIAERGEADAREHRRDRDGRPLHPILEGIFVVRVPRLEAAEPGRHGGRDQQMPLEAALAHVLLEREQMTASRGRQPFRVAGVERGTIVGRVGWTFVLAP